MLGGISPIELNGMVGRTQDFSVMKHNDDAKPIVDQGNFQSTVEQNVQQSSSTVKEGQQTDTNGENSGRGGSRYAGDGGRNRKKKDEIPPQGKMLIKGRGGFDVTI